MKEKKLGIYYVLGYTISAVIILAFIALGTFINAYYKDDINIFRIVIVILTSITFCANIIIFAIERKKFANLKGQDIFEMLNKQKEEVDKDFFAVRKKILIKFRFSLYYSYIVCFVVFVCLATLCFPETAQVAALLGLCLCAFLGNYLSKIFIYLKQKSIGNQRRLDRTEFAYLYQIVDDILKEENINKKVYICDDYNESVSIAEMKKYIEIVIGLQALMMLSKEELVATIYHEIAHFQNRDTEYGQKYYKFETRMQLMTLNSAVIQAFFFPFTTSTIYNTQILQYMSTIHFEKIADQKVLEKNKEQDLINFLAKLKAFHVYSFAAIDKRNIFAKEELSKDCFGEEYKTFVKFYEEHKDFIHYAINNSLSPCFATHPEVNQRMEALNVKSFDIKFKEVNDFENEINLFKKRFFHESYELNNEQFKIDRKDYLDALDKIKALENKKDLSSEELLDLMTLYLNVCELSKALEIAYTLEKTNPKLTRAKFIIGLIEIKMNLSPKGEKYLKEIIEDKEISEFLEDSYDVLGNYYLLTANVEGRDWIRERQVGGIDKMTNFEKLSTLEQKDKLRSMEFDEIKETLIEMAKKNPLIHSIIACTKTLNNQEMTHVILVFDKKNLEEKEYNEIKNEFWLYLDTVPLDIMFFLQSIFKMQLGYLSFLKKYTIYKKEK